MIIGITGSIGSGKTTVSRIFNRHGFEAINADEIGHEVIKKGSVAYKKIIKDFGGLILDKSRNIDRKKLGDIVFQDKLKLKKLNSITHPEIHGDIKKRILEFKNQGRNAAVDAPLLFESKMQSLFDNIIVVVADERVILKRLHEKYPVQKIKKILKSQMPAKNKMQKADFVIKNNADLKILESQVIGIIKKITIT